MLAAIIAIHEAGHFAAARSQGIHVTKFAIGFGPAVLSYQVKVLVCFLGNAFVCHVCRLHCMLRAAKVSAPSRKLSQVGVCARSFACSYGSKALLCLSGIRFACIMYVGCSRARRWTTTL